MSPNRSLDEFTRETEGAESPSEPATVSDDESAPASPPSTAAAPAPVGSTYVFTPDGAPCAVCGTIVEERWRAEPGLVCVDCKAW